MPMNPIHQGDLEQNVSAAVTGAATGVLGIIVPIVGLTAGLVAQLVEKQSPFLMRHTNKTNGIVDGSAALFARVMTLGLAQPYPQMRGQNYDDTDGMIG